ncbi:23S rRNA pseudouridine1911/1915/1917 synthase [Natranaerovirga hydrolytica]|uniref:Pseudouridine synthase n=1 Tax=Natranaerovirga hydrolytica TaxID=680378 RepID=A0A4R1N562_9FIRM|nr:RluA family pseudouridine synthase [Natranaerovirga hydrolytica]TCK98109.1 23S rRNA pseudouridine1911/1915/1917 synthase [Natranaerovirga hydrolytica]
MKEERITVLEEEEGVRIDKYISNLDLEISRSYIQKLIKDQHICVNDQAVKPNYKLNVDDHIKIKIPDPEPLEIVAEDIPLDIVYEDHDVILVNKPKDMVVHPSAGHTSHTLVNALLYHCKDNLSGINGVLRPGIVHRIDKDTTGILIVCKNDNAHMKIANQLKEHSITRKYHAIVYHNLKEDQGSINAPIGRHPVDRKKMAINQSGKHAVTHYNVLDRLNHKYNHIECQLETGRTHQIRVHMASIHHPIIGDTTYGPSKDIFNIKGQALHAKVLGFIHPTTNEYMEFETELPHYYQSLIKKIKSSY